MPKTTPCLLFTLPILLAPGALAQEATSSGHEASALRDFLEQYETLNVPYRREVRAEEPWRVFQDLNLEFTTSDNREGESVLGLSFDYDRVFGKTDPGAEGELSSFVALRSAGSMFFDSNVRQRDLWETRLTWRLARDAGGSTDVELCKGFCLLADEGGPALDAELVSSVDDYKSTDDVQQAKAWRDPAQKARRLLHDQLHYDVGLDLALENNQDFSQRNLRVGLGAALEYKTWRHDSAWARFNVLDYPAALGRLLTGYDRTWTPSGTALPILELDLSQILVDEDSSRISAGDSDDFQRAHLSASYRSALGNFGGELYHLNAAWHYYADLDPSSAVEAAGLDEYDFAEFSLTSDSGVFFAFNVGQLPFESRDRSVASVGLRLTARGARR